MEERVVFHNSKGDSLVGIFSYPNKEVKTVVILCHGHSSSKDGRKFLAFEKIFNQAGLASFRFDFYGHGESDGEFEDATISEALDDALHAIDLMKSRGYRKICLIGSSFGGTASILAASKSRDIDVLALIAPVSDYVEQMNMSIGNEGIKKWKVDGLRQYSGRKHKNLTKNYSFYEDALKIDGYVAASKISVPTIVVHGDKDVIVPIEQSKKSSNLIKNSKLVIIKGCDHFFDKQEYFDKLMKEVSEFIITNL